MDGSAWCVLFFMGAALLMIVGSIWHRTLEEVWVDECVITRFEEPRSSHAIAPGSLRDYCEALERQR